MIVGDRGSQPCVLWMMREKRKNATFHIPARNAPVGHVAGAPRYNRGARPKGAVVRIGAWTRKRPPLVDASIFRRAY